MPKREANCLEDLLIIREHNRDKIDAVNQNLGSALGYKFRNGKNTKHPAIIVFVPEKINEKFIPKKQIIDRDAEFFAPDPGKEGHYIKCKVDVVRGGKAVSEERPAPLSNENVEIVENLRMGRIGLTGGVQLGGCDEHGKEYVGTAACAVKDENDKIYLLTNQHISGPVGRSIYHPRQGQQEQYLIGKTKKTLEYVDDLVHFDNIIDEKNALIRVDCALVSVNKDILKAKAVYPGVYRLGEPGEVMPVNLDKMDIIGIEVNDKYKAYPFYLFNKTAIIIDEFEGMNLLVYRNSDTGTIHVYDRQIGEVVINFEKNRSGTTDSVTDTIWDLENGIGIKGRKKGETLRPINFLSVYWFVWVDYFPDTEIFGN